MREGPQPARCVVESCDRPPAALGEVFCGAHLARFAPNGSAVTPAVVEPDDPALLERAARRAAAQEEREYAERRRVKTWRTLENGSRVPEEFWSDEELEAVEAEAGEQVRGLATGLSGAPPTPSGAVAEDPVKVATRRFKRALKGRYGPAAERLAWALADTLDTPHTPR